MDHDAAMAKALASKWPATCHRLCIWHIYQNVAIHISSSVFARFPEFLREFSSCVYEYEEEEEFLLAWHEMLEKYGLQTNEWLERLFKIKEKWALVYGRQSFCADMTSTQCSESMNSTLKKYVSYKEQHADITTNHSTPVELFPIQISKHDVSVYTHEVFQLFQTELQKSYDAKLDFCGEIGEIFEYKVTPFQKHFQHRVMYDSSQDKVSCSCKKFKFVGILCSHSIKVLSLRNITKILDFYIKKRWTKKVKKDMVEAEVYGVGARTSESINEKGEKEMINVLCNELYSLNNQLLTRAALTVESLKIAKKCLLKSIEEVEASLENGTLVKPKAVEKLISTVKVCKQQVSVGILNDIEKTSGEDECIPIRGWKNKEIKTARYGKRPRSGLEKNTRKRKQKQNNMSLASNANQTQSFDAGIICPSNVNATQDNSLATLSHLSQGYDVGMSNLKSIYSSASSLPYLQPIQFTQVFNPTVSQQDNLASSYSKKEVQSAMNLTQLLQQQIINSEKLGRPLVNNSMSARRQKDANS